MKLLHSFFCLLLIFSGYLVSFSVNPIESVIFLILSFCNASIILFIFNSEFLGLLFIMIYVGAVAVLFLFVIMMLNVKSEFQFNFQFIQIFFSFAFIFFLFFFLKRLFVFDEFFNKNFLELNILLVDCLYNIDVLGQILYNYFFVCFLIAGFILLVSLIGSIVLTLKFSSKHKSQLISRQLSRQDNFLSFFK
jgi:NADH-quinone oxidoreductase subunit J